MRGRGQTVVVDSVLYGENFNDHGDTYKAHFPGEEIPRQEFERLIALPVNRHALAHVKEEPAPEKEPAPQENLADLPRMRLLVLARERGLDVSVKNTKPELLELLAD